MFATSVPGEEDGVAAGSLLTAFLSDADACNHTLGQELGAPQRTLREIYRNSGDIELQNEIAPFKLFDNLYHVGPGLCVRGLSRHRRGSS